MSLYEAASDIVLPVIFRRVRMFRINESTMEGLKRAGCDAHLLIRIMRLIRSTKDSVEKIELFNDYIDKLIRQHLGSMMNNDMRSTNAQFAGKYIDQV